MSYIKYASFARILLEQRAIAAILATWDRAIEQTTWLIEAKRRLKQGLMQQLLTGKRQQRLSAASKWEKRPLGKVADFLNGLALSLRIG